MEALQFIGSLQKCGRVCRGGVSSCASHPLRLLVLLVALFSFGWGNAAYADTYYWYYGLDDGSSTLTVTKSSAALSASDHSFSANGKTINGAVKLYSSGYVKFTTSKTATVTLGISTKKTQETKPSDSYVKFDGVATEKVLNGIDNEDNTHYTPKEITISNVGVGEHTITRGGTEMGIYYIKVVETEETQTPTAPTATFTYGETKWTSPSQDEMTITVPSHKGGKTFEVTLSNISDGATATCTQNGTLSDNTLTITAPTSTASAAEQTTTVTLTNGNASTTYNIKVTTEAKTGITFDSNKRYSQLLIDNRTASFYANTTASGINSTSGTLDYVPGLVAKAMIEAVDYYKDNPAGDITLDEVKGWFGKVQGYGDSHAIKDAGKNGESFDDLNAVKLYFGLKSVAASGKLSGITNNTAGWNEKIKSALGGIKTANTNYVIKSGTGAADMEGGWWHKSKYENQMWCDGQYMGTALLAQMINDDQYKDGTGGNSVTGTKNGDWDLICKQLDITWKYLWNDETKLIHHAFAADNGEKSTSSMWEFDKDAQGNKIYRNQACWARAAGWYFLALIDVLEQMDKAEYSGEKYNTIKTHLQTLAAGLKARQDAETGCWYQLPLYDGTYSATDCGNGATKTRVYNYLESSATAIFAASYLKGIRLGYLDKKTYEETAKKAYQGIIEHFMTSDYNIYWSSRSAGLGGQATSVAKLRKGSNAYYLKGFDVVPTKVTDDNTSTDETGQTTLKKGTEGKVLGAMILAAVEYERAYMSNAKTVKVDFASPCHDGDTSAETEYRGKISVKVGETDYTSEAKSGAPIPSGSDVTLTATAYSSEKIDGCPKHNKDNNLYFSFYAWKNRADGTILSTEPTYTISSLDADKDIIAVFRHASNSLTFVKSESSAVNTTVNEGSTSTTKKVTFLPADAGKQYVIDVTNKYNSAISPLYNGSALNWYYQEGKIYITVPAEGTESYFALQTTSEDGNKINKHVINVKTSYTTEPTFNAVINYTVSVKSTGIELGTGGNTSTNNNVTVPNTVVTATAMESNSTKEDLSAKIVSDANDRSSNLHPLTATFTVAKNYKFTPGEIRIPVQSITTTKSYRVKMTDSNGHSISQDIHNVFDGALIDLVVKNTENVIFTGDVTLQLYCFGATDGYRLANPIAISGNVASLNTASTDAKLKSLSYNGIEIPLQDEKYTYDAKAISNVKPEIVAEPNYPEASVTVTYPENFSESGVVTITVKAADGTTTKTYTVNFTESAETPVSTVTWNFYNNASNNGAWNVAADSNGNLYRLNYTLNANGDAVNESGLYFKGSSLNGNGGRTVSFTGINGLGRVVVNEQVHCGQFNVRQTSGDPLAVGYHTANYTTGTSTAYTYSPTNTYYIDFNGQVRIRSIAWMPETQENLHSYTVSASSINSSYGTASVNPSGTVNEGTKVTFTATANNGYEFVNWTDASGNVVATTTTYIIYNLSADAQLTANFVTTKTTLSGSATFTLEQLNYFGGTVNADGVKTTYTTGDGYITLSSTSENVQAQMTANTGTKVRNPGTFAITSNNGATISKVVLVTSQDNRQLTSTPVVTPTQSGKIYTYTFPDVASAVTFTNNSTSGNIYVTSINVEYEYTPTSEKTQLRGSFANDITGYVGDNGIALPALTVTAGGNALTKGTDYTVTYQSSNTSAVTIAQEKINLIAAGNAVITATITPKEDQYAATTATFTVTSLPLVDLVVDVPDVTMYTTASAVTQPSVTVYALVNGENVALTAGTHYTVAYTVKTPASSSNVTGGNSITVTGESGNYTAGNNVITVTVTPTPAGVNAYHCKATSKDFNYNVVTAGQKLTPTVVVSENISYRVSTPKDVTVSVKYDGNDITDLFTFDYALSTTAYGSVSSNANVFTFTPGSTEYSGIILTITATPIDAYADQYYTVTKTCTLNIVDKALAIEAALSATEVKIGENIYFKSVTVTEKDNPNKIFSIDDGECTVEYQSSAPSVLAINASTGVMTPLAEGETTVKVIARKDAYASASWTQTVTVIDPTVYKVKSGETAPKNGTVVTDVEGMAMTYGGWMFEYGISRTVTNAAGTNTESKEYFGEKNGTSYGWGKAATDGAGSLSNFKYSFMGNSHQNPRDEMGANALPDGYYNIGYEKHDDIKPIDPMFNVPVEGAYITFAPKTNGTVIAHVLQEGAFSGSYDSSTNPVTNKLVYRRDRRVLVLNEMGQRLTDVKANLDVTTGKMPKDDKDKKTIITDVTKYSKLGGGNLTTEYVFTNDFVGFTGFTFDGDNITNFQNGLYKFYGRESSDPDYGKGDGWGVLVKAPVTYEFKVKAGKTYYLYNYGSKINVFGFQFKPDANVVVDNVEYNEQQNNTITTTEAGHVASVSLDRKFVVDKWNAAVLPFSLNKQQVDAIFGTTYDKDHPKGTQILYFEKTQGKYVYYTRHAYNTIVAGKPFLIKPTGKIDDGTNVATLSDGYIVLNTSKIEKFPYVTIEGNLTPKWGRGKESADYVWQSDYNVQTIEPNDYYINSAGNLIMREGTNAKVQSFRGFLKKKSNTASAKLFSVAYFDLLSDNADIPSKIEDLMMDSNGNLINVPHDGMIYNLNGQVISTDPASLHSLPKGIYILNGKKYVVE